MLKRYEYLGPGGIKKWTEWFQCNHKAKKPAFKKLKEEYKEE